MDDHPILTHIHSLRHALATFQDEAHASAVKLQHHSLSTSRALDRVHALEHENAVLNEELSILRSLSSPSDLTSRELKIDQLTLSLRTLNEKISTTENLLAQRTQDLTNAFAELAKSRLATDAAYELASRIRGREEALISHQGELQLKLRLAEERARMSERAVGEYADFVRALEGRRHPTAAAGPYHNNNGSSQTLVHPDDKEDNNKDTIESLLREFAAEREDLLSQLSSTQHELAVMKSQHDAQAKTAESTLAELVQLRYKLQLLDRDDTTAAKMVSRYMKFSQQSTNNLQTTLQALTTRHTATLTSLTTHTHTLTHTLQSLQSHNTHLLASLDDIGGELLKESFGRRREVKVRMKLVRREERVLEKLRRWLRRSEERMNQGDDAGVWLNEMVQDAKILVDELDSPLHLHLTHTTPEDEDEATEPPPSTPISGSLARLITIQSTINQLSDELQREQSRRIRAEEALVRYQVQEYGQDDEEKEGTVSPSLPLPPPPLPPKHSRPPSEHGDYAEPIPPPSDPLALVVTEPEPGVIEHIPTTTISPPPSEEETPKPEEEHTISNLPSPPLSPPDGIPEETIPIAAVVAPTIILSDHTPTSTISEDNEGISLEVSVVVTNTEPTIESPSGGDAPEAPDGSLVEEDDNMTSDILCALPPPTIIVEPIPVPVTGAYAEAPNGSANPTHSGRAVITQHDSSVSISPSELIAAVTPATSSSLPITPPPPPSLPISLSPPLPPPTSQHPLLHHLEKARTRYDHIQRAFHDCHIALESLKSSFLHPTSTTPSIATQYPRTHAVIPQNEWFKAIIQRLDDYTEDVRVELEIRISDEEVLGRGYEALLSVPGALDSHHHHHQQQDETQSETLAEVEAQIQAFIEGSEPGIQKALGGFQKKLEDLEHDVAVVKRAVHAALQGGSAAFDSEDPPPLETSAVGTGAGVGGWTSWIPGRAPSPTPAGGIPTLAPAPTFGNIMTNRHRTPIRRTVSALGLVDSKHRAAAEEGGRGDFIKNLNLRIPMPDLSFVFPSPPSLSSHQDSSLSSSSGFGPGLGVGGTVPRSRTVSAMYMLGMGMGSRGPAVSSPLQRRIVSAVPRFGDVSAARMSDNEVDVD